MPRTNRRAAYSAGQDALENFGTLATYAVDGARKAKRKAWEGGITVTVIENGSVVEVGPGGARKSIGRVQSTGRFVPLKAG